MNTQTLCHAALLSMLLCGPLQAQDAKECKDPAMFPDRIPNYHIASCKIGKDVELYRWPGGQYQAMGIRNEVVYKVADPKQGAAPKYVAANYANAISSIGGTLLEDPAKSTLGDRVTAKVNINGQEVWVKLSSDTAVINGNFSSYKLVIVQPDASAQVVSAQKMLDELKSAGFITLYLNFDTAKWDIKPGDQTMLQQIVNLLNQNPDLRLAIEGHTDNVGDAASNKTLSQNRANAVLQSLIKNGIAADRLSSDGFGQERPIADNRSEEGRAKNRRVELVKR